MGDFRVSPLPLQQRAQAVPWEYLSFISSLHFLPPARGLTNCWHQFFLTCGKCFSFYNHLSNVPPKSELLWWNVMISDRGLHQMMWLRHLCIKAVCTYTHLQTEADICTLCLHSHLKEVSAFTTENTKAATGMALKRNKTGYLQWTLKWNEPY